MASTLLEYACRRRRDKHIYHSHSQHARGARTTALERARVVFVADTYTALPGAIRVLRRRARQSGARLAYYIATGGST